MNLTLEKEGRGRFPKSILLLLILSLIFSFFLGLDYFAHSGQYILEQPNIIQLNGDRLKSRLQLGLSPDCDGIDCWVLPQFDDSSWKEVELPVYSLKEAASTDGRDLVYYRLRLDIPEKMFLADYALAFTPSYIHLPKYDVFINGYLIYSGMGSGYGGAFPLISLPRNLLSSPNVSITIIGQRGEQDVGIHHGTGLYLGQQHLIAELALRNERMTTTLHLFWLLTIGTICIFFSLLFLFTRKRGMYVNVILFTLCFFIVELMRSDFVAGVLNLSNRLYLISIAKSVGIVALLRFFIGHYRRKVSSRKLLTLGLLLLGFSLILVSIFLYSESELRVFDIFQFFRLLGFFSYLYVFILSLSDRRRFAKLFSFFLFALTALNLWLLLNNNIFHEPALDLIMSFFIAVNTIRQFGRDEETILIQSKKLQDQARDAAIGETAASMLHDIRRPFSQMQSLLNNLGDFAKDPVLLERARAEVKDSMNGVEGMVNEVMDFSREAVLETKPMLVEALISERIEKIREAYPNIDFNFISSLNNPIPIAEGKFQRAIDNILVNAVEAIETMGKKDRGRIWIETSKLDYLGKSFAQMNFYNDGPIIPKAKLNSIFEPFSSHGKEEGTGLGLASVKKTIELHNGTIVADNLANDQGVCFKILIPLNPIFLEPQEEIIIYFCDDSEIMRFTLEKLLETTLKQFPLKSYVLKGFKTGEELLEAFKKRPSQVIFTDYHMDEAGGTLNGADVIRELRLIDSQCHIYLLSNLDENESEDIVSKYNGNGNLKAPINEEQLKKILSNALN